LHHQRHGGRQQTEKQVVAGRAKSLLGIVQVVVAVKGGQQADHEDGDQEKGGQAIDLK